MTKSEQRQRLDRLYSLCLTACKRYKGKREIVEHVRQAMRYIRNAIECIARNFVDTANIMLGMAKRRIDWANHARMLECVS